MQKFSDTIATTKPDGTIEVLPSATVTVYRAGTTTLASIYSTNTGTAKTNPFLSAAATGRIEFYAADGRYDLRVDKAGYATVSVLDVLLEDPDNIDDNLDDVTISNSTLSQCILLNSTVNDVDSLSFSDTPDALTPRRMAWNIDEGTLDVALDSNTTLQMGQELHYRARNNTASTIADGAVVWATGTTGATGRINVGLAVADGSQPGKTVMGLMTHATAAGSDGYVAAFGKVRGINTTGSAVGETWANGDVLYLHPTIPGALTKVKPAVNGNIVVTVAIVIYAGNNGTLFVRPTADSQEADEIRYTPSGAGAVATTVQSKLRETVSVKDFGAKGDNSTDDTLAIRAALNSGAKNIYVPAGVYLVRDATNILNTPVLVVPSGVSIFGDGQGSEIKLLAHSTVEHHVLHLDGVSNVTISGLKINGNRTAQTGSGDEWSHCIAVYNSLNTKITNCFLVSAKGDGVCIAGLTTNGSTGVEVSNCYFDDNYRQCISGVRGSQFRFIGNDFNNTVGVNAPGAAIDLEPNQASDILRHVTISGNTFRNNHYGVIIHDNGPVSHVTITGNTFDSQRFLDIRCSGRFVSITGNVFKAIGRTASGPAIDVFTASHVSITGNIIEGNYDSNERGGIRVLTNVSNITVSANTIYKTTGAGIDIYPGIQNNSGGVTRAVVSSNVLENCQSDLTSGAIRLSSATSGGDIIDLVLRDNCIYDSRTGGAQPAVGISVVNSTSAMRKTWSIGDNLVRGPTNQTSSFSGMRISGVTQIADAYLDFDLTSVNDQTLTIAAPGAFPGIPVSLAVPDNAGLINEVWFTAWVSATDVISVRAFKRAGTAPNPPAGFFRAAYTTILTT